jgi:competence protein ComEA
MDRFGRPLAAHNLFNTWSVTMFKHLFVALLAFGTSIAMAAVDVNTASAADLDSIKGIGPGTSSKIVEARKVAKFKDWGDFIARVSGVGDKRAVKLSGEGLTVNGGAFKAAPKPAATLAASSKPVAKTEPKARQ